MTLGPSLSPCMIINSKCIKDLSVGSKIVSGVPVAYACNTSYPGGRDQKDSGWKLALANSLKHPMSRHPSQKRAVGGMA
jgi:hypothetical protein